MLTSLEPVKEAVLSTTSTTLPIAFLSSKHTSPLLSSLLAVLNTSTLVLHLSGVVQAQRRGRPPGSRGPLWRACYRRIRARCGQHSHVSFEAWCIAIPKPRAVISKIHWMPARMRADTCFSVFLLTSPSLFLLVSHASSIHPSFIYGTSCTPDYL